MDPFLLGALGLAFLWSRANTSSGATLGNIPGNNTDGSMHLFSGALALYEDLILTEAARTGLDSILVGAIILTESSGNPDAENASGREDSIGLMQVNVEAHPEYTADSLFDPSTNIQAGTTILAQSIAYARSHGVDDQDVMRVAVAGYNLGDQKAVAAYRAGRDPDPAYTSKVAQHYAAIAGYTPW